MCTNYHGHTHYYQAVVIYRDGSDGRHVCTKYHGHTHYTMLEIVINCLRLFIMAMVVMGSMCVQSITAICIIIGLHRNSE